MKYFCLAIAWILVALCACGSSSNAGPFTKGELLTAEKLNTVTSPPIALTKNVFGGYTTITNATSYQYAYGTHARSTTTYNVASTCYSCHSQDFGSDPYYVVIGSTWGRLRNIFVDQNVVGGVNPVAEPGNYQLAVNNYAGQLLTKGVAFNNSVDETCAYGTRGHMLFLPGAPGAKDVLKVCAKDAGDAYAWRTIY